ncbi:EthD domain-containing protein [Sphingomonas glacialis]|uniref:EthD family reductase n=1 Tax=Sphingomonas glacialis TaxID=658225 RepID=A0A502FUI3_9SPHN|nr:EthD domain-containing protein [Sphingomonas glacialis]TPG52643.1 EthD family reductase [Sphingomonas glacialis]
MLKLTIMLKRREDITRKEFGDYWLREHAPKIHSLPEANRVIRRYIQQIAVDDVPEGLPVADFDGMAELWFDDLQSAINIMTSDEYLGTIPPDEPNFIDQSKTRILFTEERETA